jgi:DNA segregation ATPase FtsK/SpoIIIE-like protein
MQLLWIVPSLGYGIFLLATTGQWFGLVFGGLSLVSLLVSSLVKTKPVAKDQPVHFGKRRIAIGNRILPRWELLWKPEWVEQVYQAITTANQKSQAEIRLRNKLRGTLAASDRNETDLCLWLGFFGSEAVELNLSQHGPHAILIGPTGSGKSQLLSSLLASACQGYSAKELQLALVDFKGGATLGRFANTPWCFGFETDLGESAMSFVARVQEQLKERQLILAQHSRSRVQDLPANLRPPILVLVIDELQALLQVPAVQGALEDIAARGRSLGVHLIATAQSLTGIPRSLIANLGLRISVGKPDPIDLAQLGMARQNPSPQAELKLDSEWLPAQFSTPKITGSFFFPAGGAVSENLVKYLFLAETKTKDYSNTFFATDFVEKPIKNFDFSIGF